MIDALSGARRRRLSYRTSLAVVLPLLAALTGGTIAWRSYVSARDDVQSLSNRLFRSTAHQAGFRTRAQLERAVPAVEVARRLGERDLESASPREVASALLVILRSNPGLSWVSLSRDDGSFLGVQRASNGSLRVNHSQIVDGTTRMQEHRVDPDETWHLLREDPDSGYDPRVRPFYQRAVERDAPTWLPPYIFFDQAVPGITFAAPAHRPDGSIYGVFTVDFDLNAVGELTRELLPTENAALFVSTPDGTLVGHSHASRPEETGRRGAGELLTLERVQHRATQRLATQGGALCERENVDVSSMLDVDGDPHQVWIHCFPAAGGLEWAVGVIVPESDFLGDARKNLEISLYVSLFAVLAAMVLAIWLASRVAGPLEALAEEMGAVGRFDLEARKHDGSIFLEIDLIHRALHAMKNGLRSFAAFVPSDVVKHLVASGDRAELGGTTVELTVSFSDLAGFTNMSESMQPDALVQRLGTYLDEMTRQVKAHDGTVDKFIGDAIMAFWGAPQEMPDHALRACENALASQARLASLAASEGTEWMRETHTRFGLATGSVLVGNIGTPNRMNYTAMGDVVNLAARLESLNKQYGTRTMVSDATRDAVGDAILFRPVDVVAVKGKSQPVTVYEPIARSEAATDEDRALVARSREALDAYLDARFEDARAAYEAILEAWPDDPVGRVMLVRCIALLADRPTPSWSGVHVAKDK